MRHIRVKPISIFTALLFSFFLTGCNQASTNSAVSKQEISSSPSKETEEESSTISNLTEGLLENEYPDLELVIMDKRNMTPPGQARTFKITVTNHGDKTIHYTMGSGSWTTPSAFALEIDDLQPVLPEDHLKASTKDFITKELKPNESINADIAIMAIEKNEQFDHYSRTLASEGQYIANLSWEEIKNKYTDLVAAQAGSYSGKLYFLYSTEPLSVDGNPTGYAATKITVPVSE